MDQNNRLIAALERRAAAAPTLAEGQRLQFEAERLHGGGARLSDRVRRPALLIPRN